MMTARVQIGIDFFEKMGRDDDRLVAAPSARAASRTSCFWLGSSPSVGSSMISTRRIVQDGLRQSDTPLEAFGKRVDGLVEHEFELCLAAIAISTRAWAARR